MNIIKPATAMVIINSSYVLNHPFRKTSEVVEAALSVARVSILCCQGVPL